MYAIVKDGQIVKKGNSLKLLFPNVVIPAVGTDSFNTWKTANCIMDVVYGARKDERFYFNSEDAPVIEDGVVKINYTSIAKLLNDREESDADGNPMFVKVLSTNEAGESVMVDSDVRMVTKGLKSQWTAQVKETANKLLSATDWTVIRKAERDVAIPDDIVAKRAAIVAECSRLEAAISAAADVDALKAVVDAQKWGN